MKKRRVTITMHNKHTQTPWDEEYVEGRRGSFTEEDKDLKLWATNLVGAFNEALRPLEEERIVDKIVVDEVEINPEEEDEDLDEEDDDDWDDEYNEDEDEDDLLDDED